jgi:hypothetical protein
MLQFLLEVITQIIGEILGWVLLWLIFWPVALIVSTPFVILRALASAFFERRNFFEVLFDGYRAVSSIWKGLAT